MWWRALRHKRSRLCLMFCQGTPVRQATKNCPEHKRRFPWENPRPDADQKNATKCPHAKRLCGELPPKGAFLPWERPGERKRPHAKRLCRELPPEGAFLSWERPGERKGRPAWRAGLHAGGVDYSDTARPLAIAQLATTDEPTSKDTPCRWSSRFGKQATNGLPSFNVRCTCVV